MVLLEYSICIGKILCEKKPNIVVYCIIFLYINFTMETKCSLLFYLIFVILLAPVNAQHLPPINTFSPKQYNAGNQNWSISQSGEKYIYVANNKGLLEYNGASWQLYPSPNETILRSVNVVGDRIYTGCFMEFGYWQKNDQGDLDYTSLSKDLNIPLIDDEQFWNILDFENWVLFQSLNRIYIYNTVNNSFSFVESETKLTRAFLVDDFIYFQKLFDGIYKIENGKDVLVIDDPIVKENNIINIHKVNDSMLLVTQNKGIYALENNALYKWRFKDLNILAAASIYSSLQLKDNSFIIGTVSHGVFHLSTQGEIINQIDQEKGLSNNTVLSLFEDQDKNIWLGLDNGINCININSSFGIYKDVIGELGTVYASAVYNDDIYLGTNQGLFYQKLNSNASFKSGYSSASIGNKPQNTIGFASL